jgi:ATP-dependent Clp protease ATP-binding subunit ClpX
MDIITENAHASTPAFGYDGSPRPSDIKAYLDQYVIGQDEAKRRLGVAVYNHYKRLEANESTAEGEVEIQKSNVLLIGPTGTGKTLMAQTLARFLDVPFVIADATTLTEAGYVGEDVENIIQNLYQSADNNLERTLRGIVYIDEIDKLAKKSFSTSVSRDVSGEGVQQALLKILEGTVANITTKGNKRLPNQEQVQIDTTNVLFIVGGSFEGLAPIIERRLGRRQVGFDRGDENAKLRLDPSADPNDLLHAVSAEDLTRFGLIPEFIGRLPVVAVMNQLNAEDLVHVLTEPRNALVKQYQRLLKFHKTDLTFDDDALLAIAERAIGRRSGARGLRAVMEQVMLEIMFEVPSASDVSEVIVTGDVVQGKGQPEYVTTHEYGVPS